MRAFKFLVLVPLALLGALLLLGVMAWVVSSFPGWLSAFAGVILAVFAVWFVFARGRSASASESSLLGGSRPSKEGLL